LRDIVTYKYAIDMVVDDIKHLDYDVLTGQDVLVLFGITLCHTNSAGRSLRWIKEELSGQIIEKEFNTDYSVDEIETNPDFVTERQKSLSLDISSRLLELRKRYRNLSKRSAKK